MKKKKADEIKTIIKNCEFYGVKYDEGFISIADKLLEALIINGRALGNIASVMKASNVNIECMLKVDSGEDNQ